MDKPTPRERFDHILHAIGYIREFIGDATLDEFMADPRCQAAVQFQFLLIGEAVSWIDPDILQRHAFPWHIPRSFRNFIIHKYHGVKIERVYEASHDLAPLEDKILEILRQEFGE